MSRKVIAVDGLAGTGKTTLCKLLAEKLGYVHMSTGMLYRAVGFLAIEEGVSRTDENALAQLVTNHQIDLVLTDERSAVVSIDGKRVFDELYSPQVSEATSEVAVHKAVREALVDAQREAFPGEGLVAEGRDMGTVIFPNATVKFWVQTDEAIKVERRLSQLAEREGQISAQRKAELQEQMKIEIHERDKRDMERGLAPTVKTDDMITIENSGRTIQEVLDEMTECVASKGSL